MARCLIDAGHETYFAGGCVRDRLFGFTPTDIDIATAATPDAVRAIFPRARGVGASFGVMLVPNDGCSIEVATFRSDFAYEDGRRPGRVRYGTAEEDAQRRDFTINGLFEVPSDGRIVDLVGGRADIEARILRAIGDPEDRFEEDRLRMLRGVRFAARFDLAMEPATEAAISARADRLG
ncbi:MAG: CCA tRNA nucleotidyltransferase, partial [Phycisphaeraceae bacterium]|nr:CCA tRNA nucleotidyltransferase [Phycisphaeraceae bacterium]